MELCIRLSARVLDAEGISLTRAFKVEPMIFWPDKVFLGVWREK